LTTINQDWGEGRSLDISTGFSPPPYRGGDNVIFYEWIEEETFATNSPSHEEVFQ
jgi:hypothetical protein